jgi:Cof subfamily protein (haloacid dehalogenase superfamily)
MLCLDIDGTLLNSNHKISSRTKEAIIKLSKKKDIRIILVSARMPKGIVFLQKELEIKEPIICYSGSLVLDKDYNIISNQYIKFNQVNDIIQEAKKYEVHVSLYKDNSWIIEKLDKWAQIEANITGIKPEIIDFHKISHSSEDVNGLNKILLIGDESKINKIHKTVKIKFTKDLNIYPSKPTYLEIMNKDVSKTLAIKQLLDLYKIDKSQVIAIGDNFNDIDMLKFAEVGIAMGNAPSEVKEISKDVTLSNDEDGIVEAINKYFYN